MKEVDLVVSVLKPNPAAHGYDDVHVRLARACDAAYVQLALARAEATRLREVISWYLGKFPCFGIGSGKGICASVDNKPGRCMELSDDPNEWCASGKFLRALGELGKDPDTLTLLESARLEAEALRAQMDLIQDSLVEARELLARADSRLVVTQAEATALVGQREEDDP